MTTSSKRSLRRWAAFWLCMTIFNLIAAFDGDGMGWFGVPTPDGLSGFFAGVCLLLAIERWEAQRAPNSGGRARR